MEVGRAVGVLVGIPVGLLVRTHPFGKGESVGIVVGLQDGCPVGWRVGAEDGCPDGDVGADEG